MPVELYSVTRPAQPGLRMLAADGTPLAASSRSRDIELPRFVPTDAIDPASCGTLRFGDELRDPEKMGIHSLTGC